MDNQKPKKTEIGFNISLPVKVHTAAKMKAASVRKTLKEWATKIIEEAAK